MHYGLLVLCLHADHVAMHGTASTMEGCMERAMCSLSSLAMLPYCVKSQHASRVRA